MSEAASPKGKAFDRRLFSRVMTFVHPYRGLFWSCFVLTILLAVIGVVRPVLLGKMIDGPAMHGDRHGLVVLLWIVMGLLFLEGIVQFVQAFWTARLGLNVTFDLRQKLYERVIGFKLRYFDRTPIGTLVTRVVSDIETVEADAPADYDRELGCYTQNIAFGCQTENSLNEVRPMRADYPGGTDDDMARFGGSNRLFAALLAGSVDALRPHRVMW